MRYHFIRDCVDHEEIGLEFVGTNYQIADMLTNTLGRVRFQDLCDTIGVVKLSAIKLLK
jgi:hypothetical protein